MRNVANRATDGAGPVSITFAVLRRALSCKASGARSHSRLWVYSGRLARLLASFHKTDDEQDKATHLPHRGTER